MFRLPLLALFSLACLVIAVALGGVVEGSNWGDVLFVRESLMHKIVWQVRLPRALAAYLVGALLAYAGVLMQALLRNPLAEPFILGVSGGAALAAFASTLLGLGFWSRNLAAFAGALIASILVFVLSRSRGVWTHTRLLLTGIVLAAAWGAFISLGLVLAPERQLKSMFFWMAGDLVFAQSEWFHWAVLGLLLVSGMLIARPLNLIARGELLARSLGVAADGYRIVIFIFSALATAVAVSIAGPIGFVGLVIPHVCRLLLGFDHRLLIPAACLGGGAFLSLADGVSRTIAAPVQIPVGVITAFIGVPVFLWLLRQNHGYSP